MSKLPAVTKKQYWGECKCSRCRAVGPEPDGERGVWGVYEAARSAGIECISASYWHVQPLDQQGRVVPAYPSGTMTLPDEGMIGISGHLCKDCRKELTLGEWERLLTFWHDSKEYGRGLNGAGCSCVTHREDDTKKNFLSRLVYFCAVCRRDAPESSEGYDYAYPEKCGWVKAGVGRDGDALAVCERCKERVTILELQRLYDEVYIPDYRQPGYKPKCLCGEVLERPEGCGLPRCPRGGKCKFQAADDERYRTPPAETGTAGFPTDDPDSCDPCWVVGSD